MKKFLLTSALIFTLTPTLQANDIIQLPDGQTALNISATERVDVEQDMLVASLRIQDEGKSAKDVQKTINEAMEKAVALVKKHSDLKVETGRYYVHPDYRYVRNKETSNNDRILDKWRGSQTVTIKSTNSEDILSVTGKIQDMDFMMNSLNYQLSPKKYDTIRDGLMEKTVSKLKARAMRVAKALGKGNVDIVEINIDSNPHTPRPVYARAAKMEMMSMSADTAMPTPTAQAGETSVSMTINARAIIKP